MLAGHMVVTNSEPERRMIGTVLMESPMNQFMNMKTESVKNTGDMLQKKNMKSKKTRRGKPRKWCMDDLLDQRPVLATSPVSVHLRSTCTSPQAENVCITPRYRYDQQISPVSKKQSQKKSLRPFNDPGAPHNTTDFLIQDKMDFSFDYDEHLQQVFSSSHFQLALNAATDNSSFETGFRAYASDGEDCLTSSSDETSSDSSWDVLCSSFSYDKAQFEAAYETAKATDEAERNGHMSRAELISSIKSLSRRISVLEKRQHKQRPKLPYHPTITSCDSDSSTDVSSVQEELLRLMEVNRQLRKENEVLKSQATSSGCNKRVQNNEHANNTRRFK